MVFRFRGVHVSHSRVAKGIPKGFNITTPISSLIGSNPPGFRMLLHTSSEVTVNTKIGDKYTGSLAYELLTINY